MALKYCTVLEDSVTEMRGKIKEDWMARALRRYDTPEFKACVCS